MEQLGRPPIPSDSPNGRVFEHDPMVAENIGGTAWIRTTKDIGHFTYELRKHMRNERLPVAQLIERAKPAVDWVVRNGRIHLESIYERAAGRQVDISVIHLVHTLDTAEQRILWPLLCEYGNANKTAAKMRKELSASVYGQCGELLEKLYYPSPNDPFKYPDSHRLGGITELTALCVLNRTTSLNRITLLGTPYHDDRGIDIVQYTNHPGQVRQMEIQAKTSGYSIPTKSDPVLLTADDLGNRDQYGKMTFKTTEAIIAELRGEQGSQWATEHLDQIEQRPKLQKILSS